MKRLLLMILCVIATLTINAQKVKPVSVYVTDSDKYTNVRNNPNGEIVGKINNDEGPWCMYITQIKNNWCKVKANSIVQADPDTEDVHPKLKPSDNGYWIHNSMIGFSGVGDGRVTLYEKQSKKSKVVYRTYDWTIVHPVTFTENWIKVKTSDGKHTGWMPREEICSNPLTNCC